MSFTDSSGRHLHGIEPMVFGPENGAQTHFARTTREAVVHISGVRPLNQHEQLVAQHIGLMRAYGAAKFQQSLLNSFL